MTLRQEDTGVIEYEVRSEVVRRNRVAQGKQSRNNVWRQNRCGREEETILVRRTCATHMGIGIAAFF